MNNKIRQLFLFCFILFVSFIDAVLIITSLFLCMGNFKWFPWYNSEILMGGLLLLPIIVPIWIITSILNFSKKELHMNGIFLFINIIMYNVLLFLFDKAWDYKGTVYFSYLFNLTGVIGVIVLVALLLLLLINTIRVSIQLFKQ
ncbi:hypothetical protein [Wukongibacter sp. M2B1]|uniref:hypothetical protein n=1 Tax=Wukongibacter sp. M2B1 TaxID=3088895 RepID=UPI003D7A4623